MPAIPVVRKMVQLPVHVDAAYHAHARENPEVLKKGFSAYVVALLERALHVKGQHVQR